MSEEDLDPGTAALVEMTASELATVMPEPASLPTDEDAYTPRPVEMRAYQDCLTFYRVHGRAPTAEEAVPFLAGVTNAMRKNMQVVGKGEHADEGRFPISEVAVTSFRRRMMRRVTSYMMRTSRTQELLARVAESALVTAEECLQAHGRWDDNPRLLKEKLKGAIALLSVCGLSKASKGGAGPTTNIQVGVGFGIAPPSDVERSEIASLRRQLYEQSSAARRQGAGPKSDPDDTE